MSDFRSPHAVRVWALIGVGGASALILLGMLPGFAAWSSVFALAATAFSVFLMLIPIGGRRMWAGLAITSVSLALGLLAVFGVLGGEGAPGALQRLAYMLVFFWILPLIVLSIFHVRRFEQDEERVEGGEEGA
jgi:hypothetical protein